MAAPSKSKQIRPTVFVIFGGKGDLSWRKLVPSLFNLYIDKRLPEQFKIMGLGRSEVSDEAFRDYMKTGTAKFTRFKPLKDEDWETFSKHLSYVQGDFTKADAFHQLEKDLSENDKTWKTKAAHIFYLSTPPDTFENMINLLGQSGLSKKRDQARLVIEKPLGRDLESYLALDKTLKANFKEYQIYRIDHYLGKETVQNILAFRFANPLFEPIWDRRYVDYVTITVAESLGVEGRGGYYEEAGSLRDMMQNHLMQLLCMVAMEPPVSFEADEIRNKKVDVMHAIRPFPAHQLELYSVRGQYGPGHINGEAVPGYRQEKGISPDANTDTYSALKLYIDNWRWQGVPFYMRTGKRMAKSYSRIIIQFRDIPHQSFPKEAMQQWQTARLVIEIQPDEGIIMQFMAKRPGPEMVLQPVEMKFSYKDTFNVPSADAYETLLWDVMIEDTTLFMRADQVEASWRLLMPIIEAWEKNPPTKFPNYAAGSMGPRDADFLISFDAHRWFDDETPLLEELSPMVAQGDAR